MTPAIVPWFVAIALNTGLLVIAWLLPKKLLTPAGYLHAWLLGVVVWGCLGWRGYLVVMAYFLIGSGVTRIGLAEKEAAGIAENRSGVRGPENVWGSALTATGCALGVLLASRGLLGLSDNWLMLFSLGYVASFATKLSDTCASEVGKAYGKRTFLITTLQPVPAGTEGAVSLEGTLAGMGGSAAMAIAGWTTGMISLTGIGLCLVAAFVATNLESVIGATLQDAFDWLTNEVVNIINTTIGAIAAMLLAVLFL
jgi:uncharacterized protein (TIGR00297 family)